MTDDKYETIVYCYDPSHDNWTTLPPLPVRWFGLGQVNGKLVAVGGRKKTFGGATNDVSTYDDLSRKWTDTIPPMSTSKFAPGVLSLPSALLVAGGTNPFGSYVEAVEIFKADTSQWHRTDPLPTACREASLVIIGNTCYALGGFKYPSHLNQALYASVDDLLSNAVPADQTTDNSSSNIQLAWKRLENTPNYGPAAAVLAGNLLAIGGKESSEGELDKNEVYMFSPSTNAWIYFGDLPKPRSKTAVAVLSSTEFLVIGGRCEGQDIASTNVNTTYKGTSIWCCSY